MLQIYFYVYRDEIVKRYREFLLRHLSLKKKGIYPEIDEDMPHPHHVTDKTSACVIPIR
jgi:hypothetical protein